MQNSLCRVKSHGIMQHAFNQKRTGKMMPQYARSTKLDGRIKGARVARQSATAMMALIASNNMRDARRKEIILWGLCNGSWRSPYPHIP